MEHDESNEPSTKPYPLMTQLEKAIAYLSIGGALGLQSASLWLDHLPCGQYHWHVVVLENELPTLVSDEYFFYHL